MPFVASSSAPKRNSTTCGGVQARRTKRAEPLAEDSRAYAYFADVKAWVKRGCQLYRNRDQLSARDLAEEDKWLRKELKRLQACPLDHEKAVTLQERIKKHDGCWLVFLDDPRVPPTNNLAEQHGARVDMLLSELNDWWSIN